MARIWFSISVTLATGPVRELGGGAWGQRVTDGVSLSQCRSGFLDRFGAGGLAAVSIGCTAHALRSFHSTQVGRCPVRTNSVTAASTCSSGSSALGGNV